MKRQTSRRNVLSRVMRPEEVVGGSKSLRDLLESSVAEFAPPAGNGNARSSGHGVAAAEPADRGTALQRLIVAHGMMRSGNHAIIDWIQGHAELPFFNAVLGPGRPLDGSLPTPKPMDFAVWRQRPVPMKRLQSKPAEQILVSLEDHEPGFLPFYNVPGEILHVLVLRDPYNTFASRIRMMLRETGDLQVVERMMPELVELWMRYAREFLGMTGHLENKVCIDYNNWFESRTYRKVVSAQLGFRFTDAQFSKVSGHGGGSSFDGRRFNRRNTMMNVLRRFEQLSPEERRIHEEFVCRKEVGALATRLWRLAARFRHRPAVRWSTPEVRRG